MVINSLVLFLGHCISHHPQFISETGGLTHLSIMGLFKYISAGADRYHPELLASLEWLLSCIFIIPESEQYMNVIYDLGVTCWSLLATLDFRFLCFFSFRIVPSICEGRDISTVLPDIDSFLSISSSDDVSCIGIALVYSALFMHQTTLRSQCFSKLCYIAAAQPSLDTVDSVINFMSTFYKFPADIDLAEQYLPTALEAWTADFAFFPKFLYGIDEEDDTIFYSRYGDQIALSLMKSDQHSRLLKEISMVDKKSMIRWFPTLFSYALQREGSSRTKVIKNGI
jgi:hypothetical protein